MSTFYGYPIRQKTRRAVQYLFIMILMVTSVPLVTCLGSEKAAVDTLSHDAFLEKLADKTLQESLLVFDEKANKKGKIKHDTLYPNAFRSTAQIPSNPFFLKEGLDTLRVSGSSQFSATQLVSIIQEVTQREHIEPSKFIIVDLRQEPHFFMNGRPFSIAEPYFDVYANQTAEEILEQERDIKRHLDKTDPFYIHKILEKEENGTITKSKVQEVSGDKIITEEMLATQMGVRYVRFSVQDHCRPDDAIVDKFLNLVETLPERSWMHFHCRGGKGRTSTFFLMYDILKNHAVLSLNDLMARQVAIGGKDLQNAFPQKEETEERLHFIHLFHAYVTAKDGYSHQTWQEWLTKSAKV